MAAIAEKNIVIRVSKLVKAGETFPLVLDAETKTTLEAVALQLLGEDKGYVIEVDLTD